MKPGRPLLIPRRGARAIGGFSPDRLCAIFETALRLKAASTAGGGCKPLRGRNLALLYPTTREHEAPALQDAALELGAGVAHVTLGDPLPPVEDEFRSLSQLLGRLYDALDCSTLPTAVAQKIEMLAGVPVFSGLEREDHPAMALADLMTMHEHGCRPGPAAPIDFLGNPRTPRGTALVRTADWLGFEMRPVVHGAHPSNQPACSVDATTAGRWVLTSPSGRIHEVERATNFRFVLQAVLICTISAR